MKLYKNNIIFEYKGLNYNVPLAKPWMVYTGNENIIDYGEYEHLVDREIDPLNYFTLHITEKCNLKCSYCFEKDKKNKNIEIETIYDFTKFIISLNLKKVNIRLFGGEPLLDLNLLEQILIVLDEELTQKGVLVKYNIFTNGTQLSQKALDLLNKYEVIIFISIDGCKESHDKNRIDFNGKGSYDFIINNIRDNKELLNFEDITIRSILNPFEQKMSLVDLMEELTREGFNKVSIEFPWVENSNNIALNENAVEIMKKTIQDYGEKYIENIANENYLLIGLQPFGRIISSLLNKKYYMSTRACGAGSSTVAVSVDGNLYPCHSFVGNPKYKLGNLKEGITNFKLNNQFIDYSADKLQECIDCPIKYICSRRCAADSYFFNKSIYKNNKYRCELQKEIFKVSIYIYNELNKFPKQKRTVKIMYNKGNRIFLYT